MNLERKQIRLKSKAHAQAIIDRCEELQLHTTIPGGLAWFNDDIGRSVIHFDATSYHGALMTLATHEYITLDDLYEVEPISKVILSPEYVARIGTDGNVTVGCTTFPREIIEEFIATYTKNVKHR